MTARLLLVPLTLAVLLAGGAALSAKPPDLPLDEAIICAPDAPRPPDDSLLRAGIHAALGCPAAVLLDPLWVPRQDEDEAAEQPLNAACACVGRMVAGCGRVVAYCLAESGATAPPTADAQTPAETKEASPCPCPFGSEPPPQTTCPYLKRVQPAVSQPRSMGPAEGLGNSVLDNLDKLEQAQKLYHKAEHFQHKGQLLKAASLYDEIHSLVPGTSWDELATAQLARLRGIDLTGEGPAEAEEPPAAPAEEMTEPLENPKLEGHARVTDLLKRCEQAFQAGDYETAERLVLKAALKMQRLRQQMYTLTPALPACGPTAEQQPVCTPAEDPAASADEEGPLTEPFTDDNSSSELLPQMDPPAVDPKIVDALEKVLAELGEPGVSQLIIQVEQAEEPPDGAEEQEEEPVSQWPYLPSDVEMPSLYIAPPPQDLTIEDPDAPQDADDDDGDGDDLIPPRDLNGVLREVLETLQQGASVEVDGSQPGNLRIRCEFQVGGVECRVLSDNAGHGYVICTLLPEESKDLRAAQRAHNDQIIQWIESISSNDGTTWDDDEPSESDDSIDDSPDDDLTL